MHDYCNAGLRQIEQTFSPWPTPSSIAWLVVQC